MTNTIDPLGGSYFVEALTDELEAQAYDYFAKIDELGGMVEAVKQGFPQREIADAAFAFQQEVDAGARTIVGVNGYTDGDDGEITTLRIDPALERRQIEGLQAVRAGRDQAAVDAALARAAATPPATDANLMPLLLDAARALRHRGRDRRALQARVRDLQRRRRSSERSIQCPPRAARSARSASSSPSPASTATTAGAKIIARALRDAGMEVIYTGLHQTPEQIVETVIQEDADAVGLSILSGAHMTLVPEVVELLREQEAGDVVVTVGGTIPADDIPELKRLGVAEVFTPGRRTQEIIDFIGSGPLAPAARHPAPSRATD